jgi:hypothetical protein
MKGKSMGHKVFVSYKFSDAAGTRDRIITALKGNGSYYKGEVGYKALEVADNTMKQYLGSMIFDSTVTVVIISPNVTQSRWVDWEIKYSLENHTRRDRSSGRNGIVCVIQKQIDYSSPKSGYYGVYNDNSNWAYNKFASGKDLRRDVLPNLIWRNMKDSFQDLKTYRGYLGNDESNTERKDYCIVVAESTFLLNPNKYIDEAYNRAYDYYSYQTETR